MPFSISYFEDVTVDVKEAKAWYKKRQLSLEKRFSESIKTAILKLQENPFAYSVRHKNIRIAHPKTFPYGIHFYISDDKNQIVIVAYRSQQKRFRYCTEKNVNLKFSTLTILKSFLHKTLNLELGTDIQDVKLKLFLLQRFQFHQLRQCAIHL